MINLLREQLTQEGHIKILVRARPNASTTRITGRLDDGSIKIDIAAPTENNKANIELVKFLSSALGIPTNHIQILSGQTARQKLIRITA